MEISGYKNLEELYTSNRVVVYRAEKGKEHQKRIIKIMRDECPTPEEIARLRTEFDIASQCGGQGTVRYFEYGRLKERPYIVMDDVQGISLSVYRKENAFDLHTFIDIAIKIATALSLIHKKNIIHKDLNPNNILFSPKTGDIHLIDFDIATQLNTEIAQVSSPEKLEGTLEYIAPEQTGRMNRPVDYRSDYYSLGATLYQLLYDQVPFRTEDPVELIHAHIAKKVEFPSKQEIPELLHKIINKLLAKNPEDRYLSLYGLLYDLRLVQENLEQPEHLVHILPGEKDLSNKLQIPDKLYGREKEKQQLLDALKRVAEGETRFQLISGISGSGKTALVNELQQVMLELRGYYIKGKCEQFTQDQPYRPLVQCFNELIRQILSESPTEIAFKRHQFLKKVEGNGQILTELMPELKHIIGEQQKVEKLGATETHNRIKRVFQRFISFFGESYLPFIIFIDDLQWADLQTLEILKEALVDPEIKYFYVIGTYRDSETDCSHLLTQTIKEIEDAGVLTSNIKLQNLEKQHITQLLADTFSHPQNISLLADLVVKKTDGNPFFVKEFIKTAYLGGDIKFDQQKLWHWDIEKIEQKKISDNVVELMEKRLLQLPKDTMSVLKNAASIGIAFDLLTLSAISGLTPTETHSLLWVAAEENFVIPISNSYKLLKDIRDEDTYKIKYSFLHDKIQEATYRQNNKEELAQKHLKIARLFFDKRFANTTELALFDIADHYNKSLHLITSSQERVNVCNLNLEAGRKAKQNTAYNVAYRYLTMASDILSDMEEDGRFYYDINKELGECEYLLGDHETAIGRLSEIYQNAQNDFDKLNVALLEIDVFTNIQKYDTAIEIAIRSLNDVGIQICNDDEFIEKENSAASEAFKTFLAEHPLSSLLHKVSENPIDIIVTEIFASILDTSMVSGKINLTVLSSLKIINSAIQNGINKNSSIGFVLNGMFANVLFNDLEQGYNVSAFGVKLANEIHNPKIHHKVLTFHGIMSGHLKEPFYENISTLSLALKTARQNGDYAYANYALVDIIVLKFSTGEQLAAIDEYIESYRRFLEQTNIKVMQEMAFFFQFLARAKQKKETDFLSVNLEIGKRYSETVEFFQGFNYWLGVGVCTIYYCEHLFMTKQYRLCLEVIRKYPEIILHLKGFVCEVYYYFYYSLSIYKNYAGFTDGEKTDYKVVLQKHLEEIKKYADCNPENYLQYYAILKAEQLSLEGRKWEVTEAFEQAIESAQRNNTRNIKAIGYELLADFYFQKQKYQIANLFVKQAHYAYSQWGDNVKLTMLEAEYPQVLYLEDADKGTRTLKTIASTTASGGRNNQSFDLTSVLKFAHTLSEEVNLGNLLQKMMSIIIENAGANIGYLLLKDEDGLLIEAEARFDSDEIQVLRSINIDTLHLREVGAQLLPLNIIHYVSRTKETLVLDNTYLDSRFAQSHFVQEKKTKSVLCMPLVRQGELLGILYLENSLSEGVFTSHRLQLLEHLSTQIMISIDNARIYENLEGMVLRRTYELDQTNAALQSSVELISTQKDEIEKRRVEVENANQQITASINYARRIQNALLPADKLFRETFSDYFIFYKPRDIVGGDFYWAKQRGDEIFVLAADCTGHGVPGGFVSMLGISLLNEVFRRKDVHTAAHVLDALRTEIKQALKQTENNVSKDGMDAALCIINTKTLMMQYSGAYNPVYLCRNNEIIQAKPDKQPIGIHLKETPFTNTEFQLQSNDIIYLFSDGYVDQFGGNSGNKFLAKRFKELLLSICQKEMAEQKEILDETLAEWMGTEYSAVDDILVMGIKI